MIFYEEKNMKLYKDYGAFKRDGGYEFVVYVPEVDEVKLKVNGVYYKMSNENGTWKRFVEKVEDNSKYSYIMTKGSNFQEKSDPFSKVIRYNNSGMHSYTYNSSYSWKSENKYNKKTKDMKMLEVLLQEVPGKNYKEKTEWILGVLKETRYTHVELMPVFNFYDKKTMGYKPDSFFSINNNYGDPDEFKQLVDDLHSNGYGVIVDFPMMEFDSLELKGDLHNFNFNYLYNRGRGIKHPVFTGYYLDFNKKYVRDFLLSSVNHLIEEYRIDGFRFDGINEIIFEHGNNNKIKEKELEYMREFLGQIKDSIVILENITSIKNDILQLPNISVVEGSLWMYDISKIMTMDASFSRGNMPLQLMYDKKKTIYHQDFMSASLSHDMFINGIDYKMKYCGVLNKEDFLLTIKIIYSMSSFPKMVYFDMFHEAEDGVEKDFQEFVDLYDSLRLNENYTFDFKYDNGVIYYFYSSSKDRYTFIFNITSNERNDLDLKGDVIYPNNYSEKSLRPFASIVRKETLNETK
jgi:hypothetical protein